MLLFDHYWEISRREGQLPPDDFEGYFGYNSIFHVIPGCYLGNFPPQKDFTKPLAQILSRNIGFYDIVSRQTGYFKTITPTSAIIPTLTQSLMPTLT